MFRMESFLNDTKEVSHEEDPISREQAIEEKIGSLHEDYRIKKLQTAQTDEPTSKVESLHQYADLLSLLKRDNSARQQLLLRHKDVLHVMRVSSSSEEADLMKNVVRVEEELSDDNFMNPDATPSGNDVSVRYYFPLRNLKNVRHLQQHIRGLEEGLVNVDHQIEMNGHQMEGLDYMSRSLLRDIHLIRKRVIKASILLDKANIATNKTENVDYMRTNMNTNVKCKMIIIDKMNREREQQFRVVASRMNRMKRDRVASLHQTDYIRDLEREVALQLMFVQKLQEDVEKYSKKKQHLERESDLLQEGVRQMSKTREAIDSFRLLRVTICHPGCSGKAASGRGS